MKSLFHHWDWRNLPPADYRPHRHVRADATRPGKVELLDLARPGGAWFVAAGLWESDVDAAWADYLEDLTVCRKLATEAQA